MISISVRNFRGISSGDIELAPLAIVGGRNAAGKTSMAQAIQSLLTQVPIPVPGVAKKDAKLLVTDGQKQGSAQLATEGATVSVEWPKCKVDGDDSVWSSAYAAGMASLLDLPEKERGKVLAGYVDCNPGVTELIEACADVGYGENAASQMWESIKKDGWDAVHGRAREHSTKLKGQWEGLTGEKYGEVKAASWMPNDMPTPPYDVAALQESLAQCQAEVERRIAASAIEGTDRARLEALAKDEPKLATEEQEAEKEAKRLNTIWRNFNIESAPQVPEPTLHCPECGTMVDYDGEKLVTCTTPITDEDRKTATEALAFWKQRKAEAEEAFNEAYRRHNDLHKRLVEARRAGTELKELKKQGSISAAGNTDVATAREALQNAEHALNRVQSYEAAKKLHTNIERNNKLVEILAPTGLRQKKLVGALSEFNDRLEALSKAAKWPTVSIDPALQVFYGTRPSWSISASQQWRARVILQVAMAQEDGSTAVVIDEADILDFVGRNGLVGMLKYAEVPAVVFMTINKPELVPDLAKVSMGRSYWVSKGEIDPLGAQENAA